MLSEIEIPVYPFDVYPFKDAIEHSIELLDKYAVVDHVFVKGTKHDFYRLSARGKRIFSIMKE